MYARSYEKNGYEEAAPPLPSGYRGTAFEQEPCEEATAPAAEESIPASLLGASGEGAGPLAFLEKLLPMKRLFPSEKGGFFGSLFSDAEQATMVVARSAARIINAILFIEKPPLEYHTKFHI